MGDVFQLYNSDDESDNADHCEEPCDVVSENQKKM